MSTDATPASIGADALRVAAQAALMALEHLHEIDTDTECITIDVRDEIDALRAALAGAAQPAAVPHAQMTEEIDNILSDPDTRLSPGAERALSWLRTWTDAPLVLAAAPKAESVPAGAREELREGASYESMNLAAMVLSDCGHSSNYEPLLERVAGRIDRHVERLLTALRAALASTAQPAVVAPTAEQVEEAVGMGHGAWDCIAPDELIAAVLRLAAAPKAAQMASDAIRDAAPAAQGDAERLDWLLGEGRSMAIDSCDGEYRVVDAKWGLVVTDWMPTPRAAIDAARAAKEGGQP